MAEFNMDNVLAGDDMDMDFEVQPNDAGEEPDGGGEQQEQEGEQDDGWDDDAGEAPLENGEGSYGGSIYSDLAKAFVEDGIFGNRELAGQVVDANTFRQMMDAEINSRLDNVHKRVLYALNAGAPAEDIRKMEAIVNSLNGFDDASITDESNAGVELRKDLIYRAAIFNGKNDARARKEVEKSMKAGTDIEDARDSLELLRNSFSRTYNEMVQKSAERKEAERQAEINSAKALESEIMGGKGFTGNLSEQMRRRIVNNAMVQSETLPDGRRCTPLQKFCMTDPNATRILGELFTITDGFRDLGAIGASNVRKGVSRGLASIEKKLQASAPTGAPRYMAQGEDDGGSRFEIEI